MVTTVRRTPPGSDAQRVHFGMRGQVAVRGDGVLCPRKHGAVGCYEDRAERHVAALARLLGKPDGLAQVRKVGLRILFRYLAHGGAKCTKPASRAGRCG